MADTPSLSKDTVQKILKYLEVPRHKHLEPNLETLNLLIHHYTRTVPWESASRIARLAQIKKLEKRPRFAQKFWKNAIKHGTGGTCYESNYAFFALLSYLGYEGYLTINNMGESIGCHSAIVIRLKHKKYLVDVGLPIFAPLLIDPDTTTVTETKFLTYTVIPDGKKLYQIERAPHPKHNAFTLIDRPVDNDAYRAITTRDYDPEVGLFLDKVVINKVIGGNIWRFNSAEQTLHMEKFTKDTRIDFPLDHYIATQLAEKFEMDVPIISAALAYVGVAVE